VRVLSTGENRVRKLKEVWIKKGAKRNKERMKERKEKVLPRQRSRHNRLVRKLQIQTQAEPIRDTGENVST
jgi:hypothetical protein